MNYAFIAVNFTEILGYFQNMPLYSIITTVITTALYACMGLLMVHFVIFGIIGVFTKKKFPETEKKLRYGILIPTRNEENVVANLIDSIKKSNYPQENLHIFVVAHNCTDKTAKAAREVGATVYEYNNPNECTKGYALKYLIKKIGADYPNEHFDGFFILDADNILDGNFISKMNDAFVANGEHSVITSFRNSKNFGTNVMSALYGLYFVYGCRIESRGRTVLGCSTRVQGTGYIVPASALKDGWKYVTLTEDWEITADQIIDNTPVVYCDEAMFYDEQPMTWRIMWRQRLRWMRGHTLVFIQRFGDLVCQLFKSKKKGGSSRKFSIYDITVNVLPIGVITTALFVLDHALALLTPLFVPGMTLAEVYMMKLPGMLASWVLTYIGTILLTILVYVLEAKRIPKVGFFTKALSVLLLPFFTLLAVPMDVISLFCKNLGWKPIPHTDTTDVEHLNVHDAHENQSAADNNDAA